jgi:hypothetical protein
MVVPGTEAGNIAFRDSREVAEHACIDHLEARQFLCQLHYFRQVPGQWVTPTLSEASITVVSGGVERGLFGLS